MFYVNIERLKYKNDIRLIFGYVDIYDTKVITNICLVKTYNLI